MATTTRKSERAGPAATKEATKRGQASAEEVARAIFAAIEARDLDGLGELQHDDVVDDFVAIGVMRGRAAVRGFFAELLGAFPDFRIRIVRVTATEDRAVVEWEATGTFTGTPFQGLAANGKAVMTRGVDCMQFDGGKLRRNVIYYDGAGFARDVGLLPPLGGVAEKGMKTAFNALTRVRRAIGW